MPDKEPENQASESAGRTDEDNKPKLSADFFINLLNAPSCVSKGYCDDCGRCEH